MSRQLQYILKRRLILTLLAFVSLAYAHLQAQEANDILLTKAPKNNQLYPRDISTNLGTVVFEGTLDETIFFDSLVLKHTTSTGASEAIKLANSPNRTFSHSTKIEAELVDHTFEILSYSAGVPQLHYKAIDVVAGDAYLIYGQSNARALNSTNNVNHFLRTYGKKKKEDSEINKWHATYDDKSEGTYTGIPIGTWGQELATHIIEREKIPVLVINGAIGGLTIQELLPNDNPNAIATEHYYNFSQRIKEANILNNIRAMLWWQGESDGFSWACRSVNDYTNLFNEMKKEWLEDFGPTEHTFMFQPQACGGFGITPECMIQVQEAQRQIALQNPNYTLIPTGHLEMSSDNCHFTEEAYTTAGVELSKLTLQQLYNHPIEFSMNKIGAAYYSDCSKQTIIVDFNETTTSELNREFIEDLRLEGDSTLSIQNISLTNNQLRVDLSRSVNDSIIGLSFLSHYYSGTSLIELDGRSIPQFYNLPIELPDIDKDGYSCLYDCDDNNPEVNPTGKDVSINGIDEDCDGYDGPYTSPEMELDIKTKISPNPSHQFMSVYFGLISRYTLTLSDIDGTLLSTHQLKEIRETTLNLNHIKPGQYFLKIYNHDLGVSIVKRILKN
ncbi:sialate O-acetylesterase [Roseivirga pacifica]